MKKNFLFFALLCSIILHSGSNLVMAKLPGSTPFGAASAVPQVKDLGIGPIKKVVLGPVNKAMVEEGKVIYTNQCIVCHDMVQKKIGPALKNITKVRTPEYLMNLLLNSAQMQKENATVKGLLKEYNNIPMPDPGLNEAKARSVLEYLRSEAK
jgi:cytochrome c551/c552